MSSRENADERPRGSSWRRWRQAALGDAPATAAPRDATAPSGDAVADPHDEFAAWLRRPVSGPLDTGEDPAVGSDGGDDVAPDGEDDVAPDESDDDITPAATVDEDDQPDPAADVLVEPAADGIDPDARAWAVDDADDGWVDADVVQDAPAVPLLPALAGRLETIQGALATLALRMDAVAAALGSFRATFGDRVDDYTETVAQFQRTATVELDEQRRGTERLVAELRRGVSDNDTALRRLAGRVEDVVVAVGDLARRPEGEQAPEPVGPTLDEVGEAVADHAVAALRSSFEALRVELDRVRKAVGALGPLGAAVLELGEEFDRLRDEVSTGLAAAGPPDAGVVVVAVRTELDALGRRLDAGLGAARDEIHLLKRRLAVRAKAPVTLDGDQLDAIADAVLARLPTAPPAPDVDVDVDVDAVAGAVAARVIEHLERRSEVVAEAEAKEEPAPERPARRRR